MKLSFHGAARTVTGSKHLLQLNSGKKVLLDCGMFQGMGPETITLNSSWGFEPAAVDYVILSHAHIDHVGLLPKLVKDGFAGKVYCTPPTAELATVLMADSAHIQEGDIEQSNRKRRHDGRDLLEPLYTADDADKAAERFQTIAYGTDFKIDDEITLRYTDCGHIIGSAAVHLDITEDGKLTKLTFSGDVGRYSDVILRHPEPFRQADYIIMESTYGNSLHAMLAPIADQLLKIIHDTCIVKKGKLMIPSFSVGRTQELLYILNRLSLERRMPDVPVYVDSPLSIKATEIVKRHPECFNDNVMAMLKKDDDVFAFPEMSYTQSAEDSIKLDAPDHEPCVIIASSGMAEAGRIKHHIAHGVSNPKNTILIVGYCEPHSLGGRLKSGAKEVHIFGDNFEVKADVLVLESMSAHGDYSDLFQWLSCQDTSKVKQLFLVHGEYETQMAFRERILLKEFKDVLIPELHQEVTLA